MKKIILVIALLLCGAFSNFSLYAQEETKQAIEEAVQNLNAAYVQNDFKIFMETRAFFERLLTVEPDNYLAKYYLVYIDYRLYQFSFAGEKKVDVSKFYDTALERCKELIDKKQFEGEAKTLNAGLYMMRLAVNQMEAMALFPRIHELLDEAEAAPGNNPRALLIRGMMLLNTPAAFGGSPEKAVESFLKGVEMYKNMNKGESVTWGYVETLAWLGQAYQRLNMNDKAKEAYENALKLEPEFAWVKMVLLPALTKEKTN